MKGYQSQMFWFGMGLVLAGILDSTFGDHGDGLGHLFAGGITAAINEATWLAMRQRGRP